ncbi:MAG: ribonuclease HI [Spirochaetia bacterium]
MIEIYTDGGCWGNPGPGGWAYIGEFDGERFQASGSDLATTNNKMELTAVIFALEYVFDVLNADKQKVRIHTDSQYVQKGITQWIDNWIKRGWKTAAKKPVKNSDLWKRLLVLREKGDVVFTWVKGHAGNQLNEACDRLVQEAIQSISEKK